MHLTERHGKVKRKGWQRQVKGTQAKESRDRNIEIWKTGIQKHSLGEILTKIKSTILQWKYNCHKSSCNT